MHESELMAEVLETLERLAEGQPIAQVEIALGEDADRQAAETAWEALSEGTSLEHSRVIWEKAMNLLRCGDCGREYPGGRLESCLYCGGDGVVIEAAPPVSVGHWNGSAT